MSDQWIPQEPKNLALRPLDKGMVRNLPSTGLPEGAMWTTKNLWIIDGSLKRRAGLDRWGLDGAGNPLATSFPLQGATLLWRTNGTAVQTLWDSKYVYAFSSGMFAPKNWVWNQGTRVSFLSNTYTVNGIGSTSWTKATALLQAGDYISFAGGSGIRLYKIMAIPTANRLVVDPKATAAFSGAYKIKRTFKAMHPYYVDHCFCDNKIIFADGYRPLYYFDGATFSRFVTCAVGTSTFNWKGRTVAFYNNRLWTANIDEAGVGYRQRVRWSLISDHANFRDSSGGDTSWLDLPYHRGEIVKLLPLGNLLGCYLQDALYLGMATNMPTYPVDFPSGKVETGGIGLVGTRAISSFLGAHFFVGQDDIYMVQSKGIQRIGTAIVRETIRRCNYPEMIRAVVDPANDRVCFAFPESSQSFTKIWNYFYKTGGWTYDEMTDATTLDYVGNSSTLVWDNWLVASTWDTGAMAYPTWDSLGGASFGGALIIGTSSGNAFSFSTDGSTDAGTVIPVKLETGDFDHEAPDSDKTWLRIGIKITEPTATLLTFRAYVSNNRGSTWKSVGDLLIRVGEDEGYVNFRATGSLFRFKLEGSDDIAPYSIQEATMRVRGRGLETRAVAS